jgi:hypothetical protein
MRKVHTQKRRWDRERDKRLLAVFANEQTVVRKYAFVIRFTILCYLKQNALASGPTTIEEHYNFILTCTGTVSRPATCTILSWQLLVPSMLGRRQRWFQLLASYFD